LIQNVAEAIIVDALIKQQEEKKKEEQERVANALGKLALAVALEAAAQEEMKKRQANAQLAKLCYRQDCEKPHTR
jgi:hypothetical protein